jgi:hypothetical protein
MGRHLERRRRTNISKVTRTAALNAGRRSVTRASFHQSTETGCTDHPSISLPGNTTELKPATYFTMADSVAIFDRQMHPIVEGETKERLLEEV